MRKLPRAGVPFPGCSRCFPSCFSPAVFLQLFSPRCFFSQMFFQMFARCPSCAAGCSCAVRPLDGAGAPGSGAPRTFLNILKPPEPPKIPLNPPKTPRCGFTEPSERSGKDSCFFPTRNCLKMHRCTSGHRGCSREGCTRRGWNYGIS